MDLDSEGTADILTDHANLPFCESKVERRNILHHVRCLRALIDGEPRFRGIPVSNNRARLKRHARVTTEDKLSFHDLVGIGQGLIDFTGIKDAFESEIVTKRRMNDRDLRIERGAHVRYRVERVILDKDGLG